MKKNTKVFLSLIFSLCAGGLANAQTLSDGLMMAQRESCIALTYDMGSWNRYWEGDFLRKNDNIGTLYRSVAMPMIAVGLHDKLNLLVGTAYVKTESSWPNGGQLAGVQGFQDINIGLKAEVLKKQIGQGTFSVFSAVAFAAPITDYLADYLPYALGMGTREWTARGIVQYQNEQGLYARASLAHLWRGTTTAERDYYYADGSYYTNIMDVPNAWNYNVAAGMWLLNNSLRVEGNLTGIKCTSGDDIRIYNGPQPTNKVEVEQVGFFAQYYLKPVKGLGLLTYYSVMTNGRNMGKFKNFGIGATYQFKI